MLSLLTSNLFAQDINQDINTITIKGITFDQVVTHLTKSGYSIRKLDDRTKTVQTHYLKYQSKSSSFHIAIFAHVRDSVAIFSGTMCYNINNNRDGLPDSARAFDIKYTHGLYKEAFIQLDNFVKSFNREMIYSRTD